ncbi:MAG: hypothetical protein KDB57_07270 [Solirubrobacterales bacterium]|nr:hypothetical protein [Solirubrobacterales bacterium]
MGRDLAFRMFARAGAVLGLAAITSFGFAGQSGAAPADRPTDPVVLKGASLPTKLNVRPGKIVGFKWNGKWKQIPVQVDERHVVSARSLYPDIPVGYINGQVGVDEDIRSFDVEIYADPKTRSGADANANFDADDELVFLGGDAGSQAPGSAVAPQGVDASTATKVAVNDPAGGGSAYVYLFKASGNLDPSAGKDYVDYDFNLLNFEPGDTLIDDYGWTNTPNPEDSTVKTANYELHSIDRWREDELKITAGEAPGIDILDREGVSAGGLSSCGRSEFTFSANWKLDTDPGNDFNTDDEGTYVTVIDGPVRAIRSYMGANSGPYVEDVHLYYPDREDRRVNVRVHPIPQMYVWTDYSDAALGMTYRDQKNLTGVTIDGVPGQVNGQPGDDSIDLFDHEDFSDGTYAWQQVSGDKGTTTTLATAESSATPETFPAFKGFKGYYLDDSTPTDNAGERQCGGDLKAYGASGFGIDGVYPNTDPIFGIGAEPEKLSVNRIRYFGPPNQTAADADDYRARAQDPLASSASTVKVKAPTAKVYVFDKGKAPTARPGKVIRIKARAFNKGTGASGKVKVCVTGKDLAGKKCRTVGPLGAGKFKDVILKPKVKRNARGVLSGRKTFVTLTAATGDNVDGLGYFIPFKR